MNDLAVNTLASNITTFIATDYIQSVTDSCTGIYNPYIGPYGSCNYSNYNITTSTCPTKLETDSNELKINIKKFQIKFNFNV